MASFAVYVQLATLTSPSFFRPAMTSSLLICWPRIETLNLAPVMAGATWVATAAMVGATWVAAAAMVGASWVAAAATVGAAWAATLATVGATAAACVGAVAGAPLVHAASSPPEMGTAIPKASAPRSNERRLSLRRATATSIASIWSVMS